MTQYGCYTSPANMYTPEVFLSKWTTICSPVAQLFVYRMTIKCGNDVLVYKTIDYCMTVSTLFNLWYDYYALQFS